MIRLIPIHNLAKVAKLVDSNNAIITVNDFIASSNIFMVDAFEDIQLVL